MFTNYTPARDLLAAAEEALATLKLSGLEAEFTGLAKAVEGAKESIADAELASSYIAYARENFSSGDLEIDDLPAVALSEDGAFVNAWVWCPNPESTQDSDGERGIGV